MRVTIERLRTWILVLGLLLVLAIVGFFAYARYRAQQIGRDLPAKLGLEIQQSTNNFTISKSRAGRTLFVLHASKAVQYKGSGHAVLHDVTIEMYGKDGSRADSISGSQFDYDPATKTARADGVVDIRLADPSSTDAADKSKAQIRVKTSGLTFNQDTQIASTEAPLEFQHGDTSGSAQGAVYDSGKGTLKLEHDVVLHGAENDAPMTVNASEASFDRATRQLYLIKQQSKYQDRSVTSDQAVVFFRPDGGADHVVAEGHVHLSTEDGSDLKSSSGRAQFDAKGALKLVKLDGGLLFVSKDAARSLHIDSTAGTFSFASEAGRQSRPTHLQLVGAVSAVDQELSVPGDTHGSETREGRALKMDVDLATDAAGHVQPQSVLANGGATVIVHTIHENAPQEITNLKGSEIFAALAGGHQLSSLRATGDTSLEQSTPGGKDQITSGDSLLVKFAVAEKSDKVSARSGRSTLAGEGSQIASAVQEGHAKLVQTVPSAAPGAATSKTDVAKTTATADRIRYDGSMQKIELSGGTPRVVQAGSEITAALLDFDRNSGDALASGGVKATYNDRKAGTPPIDAAGQALHVIADRAVLNHAKDETTFTGAAHSDARLWQGANAITAPTIVLSRERQVLTASGPAGSVKATLLENGNALSPNRASGTAKPASASVVRTTSSSLVYSGGERKATLSGGVVAQDTTGTIRATNVELYLNAAQAGGKETAAGAFMGPGGQIDRLIAEGHVQFNQGDRSGSGEKLVYTADDGHFVLTGTSAAAPRVTDPQQGTVSGSSLNFNNRDDSVVVSHGQAPTTTDTRTRNDHNHLAKPAQ